MKPQRLFRPLCAAAFLMMVGVGAIVSVLPRHLLDLGGGDTPVGLLAATFAVAYIAVQVPLGYLADRLGIKSFLTLGYLVCAGAGSLYFFGSTAQTVLWGRVVQGLGEAPVWALGPALLSVHFAGRTATLMGRYNAAIHVGLTFGPLLGLVVPGTGVFLVYSGLCLAGALTVGTGLPASPGAADRPAAPRPVRIIEVARLYALPSTWTALSGILLWGAGYGMFLTVIPAFLIRRHGASPTWTALFFVGFYLMISATQLLFGPVADRIGSRRLMAGGLLLGAAGMGLFPAAGLAGGLVLLSLAGFGLGVFYLTSMARLNAAAPPELKGSISAAYYLAWGLGMSVGSLAVEWLSGRFADGAGFLAYAGLLALQGVVAARSRTGPRASAA